MRINHQLNNIDTLEVSGTITGTVESANSINSIVTSARVTGLSFSSNTKLDDVTVASVSAGDIFIATVNFKGTSSTDHMWNLALLPDATNTAGMYFINDANTTGVGNQDHNVPSSHPAYSCFSTYIKITSAGNLVLKVDGNCSSGTVSSGTLEIGLIQITNA